MPTPSRVDDALDDIALDLLNLDGAHQRIVEGVTLIIEADRLMRSARSGVTETVAEVRSLRPTVRGRRNATPSVEVAA